MVQVPEGRDKQREHTGVQRALRDAAERVSIKIEKISPAAGFGGIVCLKKQF